MSLQSERISQYCHALKLMVIAEEWPALAQQVAQEEGSLADFLDKLLDLEQQARAQRTHDMLTRMAGLPSLKRFEDYDFNFATGAPRQQLKGLTSLAFLQRHENIVLLESQWGRQKPPGYQPGLPGLATEYQSAFRDRG